MGVFGWLKKATKVVGKMAMDAAEEPQVQEDKTSVRRGQVANPTHDPYLENGIIGLLLKLLISKCRS